MKFEFEKFLKSLNELIDKSSKKHITYEVIKDALDKEGFSGIFKLQGIFARDDLEKTIEMLINCFDAIINKIANGDVKNFLEVMKSGGDDNETAKTLFIIYNILKGNKVDIKHYKTIKISTQKISDLLDEQKEEELAKSFMSIIKEFEATEEEASKKSDRTYSTEFLRKLAAIFLIIKNIYEKFKNNEERRKAIEPLLFYKTEKGKLWVHLKIGSFEITKDPDNSSTIYLKIGSKKINFDALGFDNETKVEFIHLMSLLLIPSIENFIRFLYRNGVNFYLLFSIENDKIKEMYLIDSGFQHSDVAEVIGKVDIDEKILKILKDPKTTAFWQTNDIYAMQKVIECVKDFENHKHIIVVDLDKKEEKGLHIHFDEGNIEITQDGRLIIKTKESNITDQRDSLAEAIDKYLGL